MFYTNFLKKLKSFSTVTIRIVAIAKDESAYLPVWIYHHLHFGFDEIEIYINNTSDKSQILLEKISKKYPVDFIMADFMFDSLEGVDFQKHVYEVAYTKAKRENVTYLMFLDIDEFWTPRDFSTNIHDAVKSLGAPDIISFEWVLKRNEETPFSFPYEETNSVTKFHIVKSLFRVSLNIEKIDVHNVFAKDASNLLANGKSHPYPGGWAIDSSNISIKKYFILHRLWRSQLEYVYLLGQGMRAFSTEQVEPTALQIKNNRKGYLLPKKRITNIFFEELLVQDHLRNYDNFLHECGIKNLTKEAQLFVLKRCVFILKDFEKHSSDIVLKEVMKNIDIQQVKSDILALSNKYRHK